MKHILFLLLMISFIIFTVPAIAEDKTSYEPNTENSFKFCDIPWNIDVYDFKCNLDDIGIEYTYFYDQYGSTNSYSHRSPSTSYGDGEVIPVVQSEYVSTYVYHFYSDNKYASSIFRMAGHYVSGLYAKFMASNSSSFINDLELIEVSVVFSDIGYMSDIEIFDDLRTKLTKLYGNPYRYSREHESVGTKYNTDYCIWIGNDGTALYLQFCDFYEEDSQLVSLEYGLCNSRDMFIEVENQIIAENEKRKNEAIRKIVDDYSGL